jgi:hypothetical protein
MVWGVPAALRHFDPSPLALAEAGEAAACGGEICSSMVKNTGLDKAE